MGDLLAVAIVVGALAEPRGEDGLDGEVELLVRIVGEVAADGALDDLLVGDDELLKVFDVEVRVLGALAVLLFGGVEGLVEAVVLDDGPVLGLGASRGNVQHDAAEHGDEAAVGVPAEALVARAGDEAVEGGLVEAEVEDGVHHARHAELGAGANGHQERALGIAETLAGLGLDHLHGGQDVVPQAGRELLARGEVVVAGLGGDGEARGSRQARVGHLGQAGTLAAQQILHPAVALGLAAAPGVDVALGGLVGRGARVGHGNLNLLGCGLAPRTAATASRLAGPR